ncbi:MAG: ferrous iron transport protein B [Porcipelethomonas sp.]
MGLTSESTGRGINSAGRLKKNDDELLVALAGNPNVGKSTVFNALTGMKQHTGNWAGKTVSTAVGRFEFEGQKYLLADIPGTYSLIANSADEEAARDFICFEDPDAVIVVCDATCLERNLYLVLQILEVTPCTVVCVNLMDEAEKKKIHVDTEKLSELLKVPVVGVTARDGKGLDELMKAVGEVAARREREAFRLEYEDIIEEQAGKISEAAEPFLKGRIPLRWASLRLLEGEEKLSCKISVRADCDIAGEIFGTLNRAAEAVAIAGLNPQKVSDSIASTAVKTAGRIASETVSAESCQNDTDRKIDRILTSRIWGIPIMIAILGFIFWLTAVGANYPSALLSKGLFYLGDRIYDLLEAAGCKETITDLAVNGVYRVLAWVVSVMLPPMAIFFPLFTLLEDFGYLPRAAFNLDRLFRRSGACGKQALTMAMGFGCNAAGVTGCRIIDSPRERLIAILTNNFMPCNGRFPTLISVISMFFTVSMTGALRFGVSALILLGLILAAAGITLLVSWILSKTILSGESSAFTLELPPYRRPQIGRVIVRSILDRTIFVLGRACAVAAPAGLVIWLLANLKIGDVSLLAHISEFLDPVGHILGMDGVILLGFILGFPANEIVLPIIVMCYMSAGMIIDASDTVTLKNILVSGGWDCVTALCMLIFTVFHFPCSTTCLTIKKETGSFKYTAAAIAIPTAVGMVICFLLSSVLRFFGV